MKRVKQKDKASQLRFSEESVKHLVKQLNGRPHRNRTCNLLIKSQLLCQLS